MGRQLSISANLFLVVLQSPILKIDLNEITSGKEKQILYMFIPEIFR